MSIVTKQPCLVLETVVDEESGEATQTETEAYYLGIYYYTEVYQGSPLMRTAILVAIKETGETAAYSPESIKFTGDGFTV